jgi:hypothetical protein
LGGVEVATDASSFSSESCDKEGWDLRGRTEAPCRSDEETLGSEANGESGRDWQEVFEEGGEPGNRSSENTGGVEASESEEDRESDDSVGHSLAAIFEVLTGWQRAKIMAAITHRGTT